MTNVFKISTTRDIFFILMIVYFAQGALYPAGGSLLSQGSLAGFLTISAIYFFKTLLLKNNKNDFYIIWTLFLLVNLVGFLFTTDFSPRHVTQLKTILTGMLPFYPFYHFAQKGELKTRDLKRVFLAVLPLTLLSFYNHRIEVLTETGRDEMVNNVAYTFVYLMPFVFLFLKRKWIGIGLILLIYYHVILGSKRGAFVTGSVGLLIFAYYSLRTMDLRYKLRSYILTFVGLFIMGYFAVDLFTGNEYLVNRLTSSGGGEARNIIYQTLWGAWYSNESSMKNLLFGFGFVSSLQLSGTGHFAHNDWLELLTSFGLAGVLPYLLIFFIGFKYMFRSDWGIDKRLLLCIIMVLWLIPTFFSMGYISISGIFRSILLGYIFGISIPSLNEELFPDRTEQ